MKPASKGPTGEQPLVSVLIPAHNAALTLNATLDSLGAQTLADWEAVVVDDGSSDVTATLARGAAAVDARIRVVSRPNGGVSAARNTGLEHARGEWIAFLDADDWLAPQALATLTGALRDRPHLDGVHCGWIRVTADGREVREICPCGDEDLLSWHITNGCAFAIHAAVVRRGLVERAGGFDPSLVTCEDWDLWVRLSRLGARWGRVDAHLAYYRMRAASASMDSGALLRDGLVVIDRAHEPDPRLSGARMAHGAGAGAAQRGRARLAHAIYSAALALGQGEDGLALLAPLDGERCRQLDPGQVAHTLYDGVPLGAATAPADWPDLAPEIVERVAGFLDALERLTGAPGLARRAKRMLERLVVDARADATLFTQMAVARPDLERPLEDITVGADVERLLVQARFGSLELPRTELPAFDEIIAAGAIADAIAADHAWVLLGEFLRSTVYPELDVTAAEGRLVVRRAGAVLADAQLDAGDEDAPRALHDHAGWLVLLQEIWGDRSASNACFYDAEHDAGLRTVDRLQTVDGWASFELADPPAQIVTGAPVRVCATVAGVALDSWLAVPSGGLIEAGTLRRELCARAGFELCRIVVREALLGQPIAGGPSLRDRLAGAAAARADAVASAATDPVQAPAGFALAPGWQGRARAALEGRSGYVIARRHRGTVGSSASRPQALPRLAAGAAATAARTAGDPVVVVGQPRAGAPAAYVPDLVWDDATADADAAQADGPPQGEPQGPGRLFFEELFAAGDDPWDYTTRYERTKYEQTLSLVPEPRPPRALELACAEGHFTAMLAPRVGELVACDVSTIALRRARARCADQRNVRFEFHDLFRDRIDGRYGLIVCSEVLYYAGDRDGLRHATAEIAGALEPGGTLLTVHANLVVDDPGQPGFDWPLPFGARVIGEAFAAAGLDLQVELANPMYRVQAYARRDRRLLRRRTRAVRLSAALDDGLPAVVGDRFLWNGGRPAVEEVTEAVTWELPVLMYHRVAPTGSDALRRWRVTPGEFEEQLDYLRSAGHRSATFAQWRAAAERHQPLAGRRVLLTFDDGYEDFAEHAWPLLRQYGFDASVFIVSGLVGGVNGWDGHLGETVPLMDWETIRTLSAEGVELGGHSVSHPMLTALSPHEIVEETAACRATLARELGRPAASFAYPYGDIEPAVARLVGACGFEFAVTTDGYRASVGSPMLLLPRLEVAGTDSFELFVNKLTTVT